METEKPNLHLIRPFSRREFVRECACGFAYLAFLGLEAEAATGYMNPLAPKPPHFPPKAKRIIFLYMHGGVSHVDTFDPKPKLDQFDGEPMPGGSPATASPTGALLKSPWSFKKYGQSGTEVSELFPHIGGCMDDICLIRSMYHQGVSHGAGIANLQTGSMFMVRPSMGSWILYGLGTENQNLPGFISICPTFFQGGVLQFGSAFLPAVYQGTRIGDGNTPATKLNIDNAQAADPDQRMQLDLVQERNREYGHTAEDDSRLDARIESYELAFRMQREVPKVMDISRESKETFRLYGIGEEPTDDFGRECLLARRMVEAGVRFVQVSHGYPKAFWDQHSDLYRKHSENARKVDKPVAGLLKDLKQRGMLKDTLVIWGTEFGRTPVCQGAKDGRDHNPFGFTMWMAGGGVKGGMIYGATDDLGWYAVENKVHIHDFHATVLYLMGLDHTKLTYRYSSRDYRLTDVSGDVQKAIIA
jgi:hypothetical protein